MIGIAVGSTILVAGFVTATFSAFAGLGGGMMMLASLTLLLDFALVMPMFGAIQTSSGISRVWLFRKHLDPSMILPFALGFIPMAMLGGWVWVYFVQTQDAQPYIKMAIATYMLLFLASPKFSVKPGNRMRNLILVGMLGGFAAMTVGAIGSVVAPFVEAFDLKKERAIAAFGFISIFSNSAKLPLFYLISDKLDWSIALAIGGLMLVAFLGTLVGRRIQYGISDVFFSKIFRTMLGVMALKLLIWDGMRLILS